jgi:hypothetical protein
MLVNLKTIRNSTEVAVSAEYLNAAAKNVQRAINTMKESA